jgi:hypothetical protein
MGHFKRVNETWVYLGMDYSRVTVEYWLAFVYLGAMERKVLAWVMITAIINGKSSVYAPIQGNYEHFVEFYERRGVYKHMAKRNFHSAITKLVNKGLLEKQHKGAGIYPSAYYAGIGSIEIQRLQYQRIQNELTRLRIETEAAELSKLLPLPEGIKIGQQPNSNIDVVPH